MAKTNRTCLNCLFWKHGIRLGSVTWITEWPAGSSVDRGDCRRHPPRQFVETLSMDKAWPRTFPDDHCGEWKDLRDVES